MSLLSTRIQHLEIAIFCKSESSSSSIDKREILVGNPYNCLLIYVYHIPTYLLPPELPVGLKNPNSNFLPGETRVSSLSDLIHSPYLKVTLSAQQTWKEHNSTCIMYKMMNMEHSMQFADHPLITLIAPIFQLCVTVMKKKSTRTSRIYFVVSVRSSVGVVADHLIAVTPALLAFLALIKMTSCSCLLTQRLPGQQLSL